MPMTPTLANILRGSRPNYDAEPTSRMSMLPFGTYPNADGSESLGLAMPSMVTAPLSAAKRLFADGGFAAGPDAPGNKEDMNTLVTSLYGGNALNPLAHIPEGALGANALKYLKPSPTDISEETAALMRNPDRVRVPMSPSEFRVTGDASRGPGDSLTPAGVDFWDGVRPEAIADYTHYDGGYHSVDGLHETISSKLNEINDFERGGFLTPQEAQANRVHLNGLLDQISREDFDGRLLSDTGKPSLMGAALAGAEAPGITAYHGSPHDFDKFDLSKIGTGEGAQAYGHGLYFAESEPVAQTYRDMHTSGGLKIRPAVDYDPSEATLATRALTRTNANQDEALKLLMNQREALRSEGASNLGKFSTGRAAAESGANSELLDLIDRTVNRFKSGDFSAPPPGHMYQVRINADPEHFLDWDRPLSQQSENVANAINSVMARKTGKEITPDFYGSFGSSGAGLHNIVSAWTKHDPGGVAQAMHEAGIPGIKYLDQGSRGAGEGSRNYVVFDPSTIEILKKYGLLGGMIGGAGVVDQLSQPDAPAPSLSTILRSPRDGA